jgi:hypothetical protein
VETLPFNHPDYMKSVILFSIMLLSIPSLGQSRHLMHEISREINRELDGGMLRDVRSYFQFHREGDRIVYREGDAPYPNVSRILSSYSDSLIAGQNYEVSIYHDRFSPKAYANMDTVYIYRTFGGNNDEFVGFANVRRKSFIDSLYTELRSHGPAVDTISYSDWAEPIYLLISGNDSPDIIKTNKLVPYLSKSLKIPWQKPYLRGNQVNSIAEIRLKRSYRNIVDRHIMMELYFDMQVSFALPGRFKNQWVRFASEEPEHPGEIMVSFVFNSLTLKVENPIILKGSHDEATPLINWIESRKLPESMFYRHTLRYAKRMYFFIDRD